MFWGDFLEVFCSLHPGGREVEKFQKNGKTSEFSNWPKTFSNVSILVLRGFFSNFYLPVHPGDQKFEQKLKKIEFLKVSKNALKVSKQVPNLFWGIFREKIFAQCTLGGRNSQKIQKSGKTSKLSKFSKNVPKNIVWACFAWLFRRKKAPPSEPWRLKKIHKNRKDFKFSKMSKNVSKIVQTCFDVIFSRFFGQCTLEGRDVEKFQRNAKTSQNSRYPNTFPKLSKQVLNLFWGFFSKKKCPVHPGGSKLGKT